jgi:predicted dehydrogenase
MTKPIRLLVLGTGGMAKAHATAFALDPRVQLVGACDVVPGRAAEFAKAYGMAKSFEDLDAAIAWGGFDAATNVTPDAIHHPTTMKLLKAGKHVLCEKPLAENFALADEMATAAEKAGVINMVNLTYRNVAALHVARKLVTDGTLGRIRHVEASYRQSWLVGNHWGNWKTLPMWLWRLSQKHGSKGVLGDVGIHILDFASFGCSSNWWPCSPPQDLPQGGRRQDRRISAGCQRLRRDDGGVCQWCHRHHPGVALHDRPRQRTAPAHPRRQGRG